MMSASESTGKRDAKDRITDMDSNKVSTILVSLQGKIPAEYSFAIRQKLESLDDDREFVFLAADLKSPLVALVLSLFLGVYGIDRFYVGDTTMGVLKLLTCGGMGIWTVIDWFLIMDAAKQKNAEKLMQIF